MAANEMHPCKTSRRPFNRLPWARTTTSGREKEPIRLRGLQLLLLWYLAFHQLDLCYSIKPHSSAPTATSSLPQNSASSQQNPANGISESPRSHQIDRTHHDRPAGTGGGPDLARSAQAARESARIPQADKRETMVEASELESNSEQPAEALEDSESSNEGSSSSEDETANEDGSPSSTSAAADDYNATSPPSASGDDSDAIEIDGPGPDASARPTRPSQANGPHRRSEAMMDLARNPQPINVPSLSQPVTTAASAGNQQPVQLGRQRQAPQTGPQPQVRQPASPQVITTTMSSLMRSPQRATTAPQDLSMRDPHQQQNQQEQLQPETSIQHQFQHRHQPQHHFASMAATERPQPTESMPVAAFNLNMGADRMLIKPHHHQLRAETMAPPLSTRSSAANQQELATESVNHELLMSQPVPINDRRQLELLYSSPSPSAGKPVALEHQATGGDVGSNGFAMRHSIESSFASRAPQSVAAMTADQEQEMAAQVSVPSICYTPLALIMVIVVTMMITILVCFCTHVLIRHLGRHRFDLIESSRQLNTKYGCGHVQNAAGGPHRPPMLAPGENGGATPACGQEHRDNGNKSHSFMLNLFQNNDHSLEPNNDFERNGKNLQRLCDEHGFAFDNPYFRDETGDRHAAYLRHQLEQQQQRQPLEPAQNPNQQQVGLLTTQNDQLMQPNDAAREQLHFIEHHISNLHNKQVTSSVKELSILGSPSAAHVVDLNSEEQRAKVIADPREGDLVSVDITGHDIIGLGFDVYGDQQEGIFIKSVQTRGPARESGCIQPGDRIKCLNISFENMTLQDACDILNCGSPYKMRLLLEKRFPAGATKPELKRARSPVALDQAIMLRQNLPPTLTARKPLVATIYNQRQPERAMTVSVANGGRFVEATRNCARRLANLISGGRSRPLNSSTSALEPYRDQFNTGFRVTSGEQRSFESAPHHHLGSAAARRQQFTLAANMSHLHPAGYRAGEQLDRALERQRAAESNLEQARRGSSPAINNGGQSREPANRSPSNSVGSNLGDRFSMDEDDDDNQSASNADFVFDSSLEQFQDRNVNHRLHGPPSFAGAQLQQVGGKREPIKLHLAANEAPINPLGSKQVSAGHTGIGARRQSAADVVGQLKQSGLKCQSELQHLEQTQSQPEIARNGDDPGDDNQSLAARSDADCNSIDLKAFAAKGRPLDPMAGQPLVGSVSTPTMNLLSTAKTQTATKKQSEDDWQRLSSRRGKEQQQQQKQKKDNIIRDETTSDSSFGADSTSKLVEVRNGEPSKIGQLAARSNPADSTLPGEAQFPSSTLSSTGTHITCLEPRVNIKKANQELAK